MESANPRHGAKKKGKSRESNAIPEKSQVRIYTRNVLYTSGSRAQERVEEHAQICRGPQARNSKVRKTVGCQPAPQDPRLLSSKFLLSLFLLALQPRTTIFPCLNEGGSRKRKFHTWRILCRRGKTRRIPANAASI